MGVRPSLPLRIHARTGVLHERRRFPQPAVFAHREQGHAAAVVIGGEYPLPAGGDGHVARSRAARRHLVQQLQPPVYRIDGERADGPRSIFIRRVQEPLVGMDRQERRVAGFRSQPDRCQLAAGRLKPPSVDSLAWRPRISAEVGEPLALLLSRALSREPGDAGCRKND